jgi:4-hydroxy-tetrahydrodipicolinate synthase
MLTPFTDQGAIDFSALTELTEHYLEAGAAGLFANCLSSEMFELTPAERLAAIRHVVKVANGAVPVVATGTFGGPLTDQAGFVNQVAECGVQAVIGITGLLVGPEESEAVFADRAFRLFDLTPGVPFGFYECPVPYKRLISPTLLQQLVATGRVIYHKDTCLDIGQVREKLRLAGNTGFGLYDAYMVHAVESLRAGSAGLSCIQGNFFPELVVWLCDNYDQEGLQAEVDRVQQFLVDHMEVMHRVYPIVAKYFLQKRGLGISTFTRRDVGVFSPEVKHQIEGLYRQYSQLQEAIGLQVAL